MDTRTPAHRLLPLLGLLTACGDTARQPESNGESSGGATSTSTTGTASADESTWADAAESSSTGAPLRCTEAGITLDEGESAVFFDTDEVPLGLSCDPHGQLRTCTANGLDGDPAFSEPACGTSDQLHVYLEATGDDAHLGVEPSAPVATLGRALNVVEAWAGEYAHATLHVGDGRFEHDGQLTVTVPVTFEGQGPERSTLAFSVNRDQSSIRVLSGGVDVHGLEIEVDLVESLSDGIHTGGRAEYGTAITVGRYLHTEPHEEVRGVSVQDVRIHRTNFTAAGISILGRSSEVSVRDLEIVGRVSTAVILHWGGHTTVAPSPAALEHPDYDVMTTYHPHDVLVDGVTVHDSARMAIISSSYDVTLQELHGPTTSVLLLLPGDEINRFATPGDRDRVMSNITMRNVSSQLEADDADYVVRATAVGTSKVDGAQRILPVVGLHLENIEILGVDHPGGASYRYGINANGLRGTDIEFANIDLASVASWEYTGGQGGAVQASYGLFLRDASGITATGLRTGARYGVGIWDSQHILVQDSTLAYTDDPPSDRNAFGIYVAEDDAPQGINLDLRVQDTTVTGYDYGTRYADNPGGPKTGCNTLELQNVQFEDVGQDTLCVPP
jgi:hypothetical protein